jgi:2-polyprenyl-3-methyl-5-hydroxy-6-metoxy-1,4-benzoquinol methylase
MTLHKTHCPICRNDETQTMHKVADRDLLICSACRHVFWREMPTNEHIREYYATAYTSAHDQINQQENNTEYYREHVEELANLIDKPKQDMLFGDIGCSYPVFLVQAAAAGVGLALGVDWSHEAQEYGLRRGVQVLPPNEFASRVPDGSLDLLRYSHTLEQLIDPVSMLAAHLPKLAPGGLLYVTQPCIPVLRFGPSPAPPHDAGWPNHLHFFSALSVLVLLERQGFVVERIFTVTDEDQAESRYGAALDPEYARSTLAALADKGEAARGGLNNFPFFAGQNLAVYARRAAGAAGGAALGAGERAAFILCEQRRTIASMATLLAKPAASTAVAREGFSTPAPAPLAAVEDALLGLHVSRLRERFGRLKLETEFRVAHDSPDHIVPWGTARDNSINLRFNSRLLSLLPTQTFSLLDLGCSGGGLVRSFIQQGFLAVGIEGSDYSQRRLRAEWRSIPEFLFTGDITRLFSLRTHAGEPVRFGVVTLWEVIEHIKEADLPGLFGNINAHLRPGGLVIMSVSPNSDIIDGIELHQTIRPRQWWIETLASLGWQNHPGIVSYFQNDFVREESNAPNSFHLILSRSTEIPVLFGEHRRLVTDAEAGWDGTTR